MIFAKYTNNDRKTRTTQVKHSNKAVIFNESSKLSLPDVRARFPSRNPTFALDLFWYTFQNKKIEVTVLFSQIACIFEICYTINNKFTGATFALSNKEFERFSNKQNKLTNTQTLNVNSDNEIVVIFNLIFFFCNLVVKIFQTLLTKTCGTRSAYTLTK